MYEECGTKKPHGSLKRELQDSRMPLPARLRKRMHLVVKHSLGCGALSLSPSLSQCPSCLHLQAVDIHRLHLWMAKEDLMGTLRTSQRVWLV